MTADQLCSARMQGRAPGPSLTLPSHAVLFPAARSDQIARATKPRALRFFKIESAAALGCALLINIFIISVFACGFADGGE